MNQFIKINGIVFNLAHIISVTITTRQLFGNFKEGCQFIPYAVIATTEMMSSDCGSSYTRNFEFYGDDVKEIEKLFNGYSIADIGQKITMDSFFKTAEIDNENGFLGAIEIISSQNL